MSITAKRGLALWLVACFTCPGCLLDERESSPPTDTPRASGAQSQLAHELTVVVTDTSGQPVQNARVDTYQDWQEDTPSARTNEHGVATLSGIRAGPTEVQIYDERGSVDRWCYLEGAQTTVRLSLKPRNSEPDVPNDSASTAGKLLRVSGAEPHSESRLPKPSTSLVVQRRVAGRTLEFAPVRENKVDMDTWVADLDLVSTDADFRFQRSLREHQPTASEPVVLPSGLRRIRVTGVISVFAASSHCAVINTEIDLTGESSEPALLPVSMSRTTNADLLVVDQNNKPIAGATVFWSFEGGRSQTDVGGRASFETSARYLIVTYPGKGMAWLRFPACQLQDGVARVTLRPESRLTTKFAPRSDRYWEEPRLELLPMPHHSIWREENVEPYLAGFDIHLFYAPRAIPVGPNTWEFRDLSAGPYRILFDSKWHEDIGETWVGTGPPRHLEVPVVLESGEHQRVAVSFAPIPVKVLLGVDNWWEISSNNGFFLLAAGPDEEDQTTIILPGPGEYVFSNDRRRIHRRIDGPITVDLRTAQELKQKPRSKHPEFRLVVDYPAEWHEGLDAPEFAPATLSISLTSTNSNEHLRGKLSSAGIVFRAPAGAYKLRVTLDGQVLADAPITIEPNNRNAYDILITD